MSPAHCLGTDEQADFSQWILMLTAFWVPCSPEALAVIPWSFYSCYRHHLHQFVPGSWFAPLPLGLSTPDRHQACGYTQSHLPAWCMDLSPFVHKLRLLNHKHLYVLPPRLSPLLMVMLHCPTSFHLQSTSSETKWPRILRWRQWSIRPNMRHISARDPVWLGYKLMKPALDAMLKNCQKKREALEVWSRGKKGIKT